MIEYILVKGSTASKVTDMKKVGRTFIQTRICWIHTTCNGQIGTPHGKKDLQEDVTWFQATVDPRT